jgi:branched-chain amino acid transport system substrate-binding protein
MRAWEKWTNANGGIDGHPVQIIIMDDQGNPAVGLADTHKLIDGDHVISATCIGIGCIFNLGPYAAQKGIPLIGPGYTALWGTTFGHPNVYEVDSNYIGEVGVLFQFAKETGATKAGVVSDIQTGGPTTSKLYGQAAKDEGLAFGSGVTISDSAPNYVAPCLALKNAGVDTIANTLGAATSKSFMDQCYTQGYRPVITGQQADLNPVWIKDAAYARGVATIPTFPWWDNSIPAVATFNQVIKQYDPAGLTVAPIIATQAWDTMVVFAAGAKAGKVGDTPTSAQLVAGLQTIKNDTFGDLTPPLTYANGANAQPPTCAYGAKVAGGQYSLLNSGQRLCTSSTEAVKLFKIQRGQT